MPPQNFQTWTLRIPLDCWLLWTPRLTSSPGNADRERPAFDCAEYTRFYKMLKIVGAHHARLHPRFVYFVPRCSGARVQSTVATLTHARSRTRAAPHRVPRRAASSTRCRSRCLDGPSVAASTNTSVGTERHTHTRVAHDKQDARRRDARTTRVGVHWEIVMPFRASTRGVIERRMR